MGLYTERFSKSNNLPKTSLSHRLLSQSLYSQFSSCTSTTETKKKKEETHKMRKIYEINFQGDNNSRL